MTEEFIVLKREIEALRIRVVYLEGGGPNPQRYSGHVLALQALPMGKMIPIDPCDQKSFLQAAKRTGIDITTLKTDQGQMVLIKLRTRSLHKCPKCGYQRHEK